MSTILKVLFGGILVAILVNVLSPFKIYIVVPTVKADTVLSTSTIKSYIDEQAKLNGIDVVKVDWIVSHESGYCQRPIGYEPDGSISYGCWQFNNRNDGFNLKCVMDLVCSTRLAMDWILAGKINKWTTWSMRHIWYQGAPD